MYTTVLSLTAYKYAPNLESLLTQQYVCVMCTLWSDNTCVFTGFYGVKNANTQLIWSSEQDQNFVYFKPSNYAQVVIEIQLYIPAKHWCVSCNTIMCHIKVHKTMCNKCTCSMLLLVKLLIKYGCVPKTGK